MRVRVTNVTICIPVAGIFLSKSLILHKILQSNVKVLSASGRLAKVYGFKIQINMLKSEIKDKTSFYLFLIQHSRTVQALCTALMIRSAFETLL